MIKTRRQFDFRKGYTITSRCSLSPTSTRFRKTRQEDLQIRKRRFHFRKVRNMTSRKRSNQKVRKTPYFDQSFVIYADDQYLASTGRLKSTFYLSNLLTSVVRRFLIGRLLNIKCPLGHRDN